LKAIFGLAKAKLMTTTMGYIIKRMHISSNAQSTRPAIEKYNNICFQFFGNRDIPLCNNPTQLQIVQ
jgi:hypothetical protein